MNASQTSGSQIFLKDYQPLAFEIKKTELFIHLAEQESTVRAKIHLQRIRNAGANSIFLDGVNLELKSLKIDNAALAESEYKVLPNGLSIQVPLKEHFVIETIVQVYPEKNKSCGGIYVSNSFLVTQCEAQDFRKITYFFDRPDCLSEYWVELTANKLLYPVLLTNGNLISEKTDSEGNHTKLFHDPFPKPCYLFAIAAGKFETISSQYVTKSGNHVNLFVHASKNYINSCDFAMESLKQCMKWDEVVYDREYDLSNYHIVCVDDFNAGAMENKGLNIFNSRFIVASAKETTDSGYRDVRDVIAHEYFHNWTGNRITCRDWFQLCLKEGLTVFREESFSADCDDATLTRIAGLSELLESQYSEDAGPLAHPPRPPSFVEIDNFYTATVYEKGGEIFRMIHNFLGPVKWKLGMDRFFKDHDGKAVTVEDILNSISEGAQTDVKHFISWFSQAGTPTLKVTQEYNSSALECTLTVKQTRPLTPYGQGENNLPVPFIVSLFDKNSRLPVSLTASGCEVINNGSKEVTLCLDKDETKVVFKNVSGPVVPSLLRRFSAPVHLVLETENHNETKDSQTFLALHDTDGVNRWSALQHLLKEDIKSLYDADVTNFKTSNEALQSQVVLEKIIMDSSVSQEFKGFCLEIPSIETLVQLIPKCNIHTLNRARTEFIRRFCIANENALRSMYNSLASKVPYEFSQAQIGLRRLKLSILSLFCEAELSQGTQMALDLLNSSDNFTEQQVAWANLFSSPVVADKQPLIQKAFLAAQGSELLTAYTVGWLSRIPDESPRATANRVIQHPAYSHENPNKVHSFLRNFSNNIAVFHHPSGEGYKAFAEELEKIDKNNPQLAARAAKIFSKVTRLDDQFANLAKSTLNQLLSRQTSADLREILNLVLAT